MPVFLAAALGLCALAAAAFAFVFSATRLRYRPDAAYSRPDPTRLRWPEAAPVESFRGHDRLLFCVHGFPSTPADFLKLVELSHELGWDLYAPLLPGCGTDWRDILSTNWEQYLALASDDYRRLAPRYRRVCAVGTSMGGSLLLAMEGRLAALGEPGPAAIATVGSPAVVNALLRHGVVMNPLAYFARAVGLIIPAMRPGYPDPEREGEDGDGDWKGYLGSYPRQAYSIAMGLRDMERGLASTRCPVLIMHARRDRIVPMKNALIIAAGLKRAATELVLMDMPGATHAMHNLVLYDSVRDRVWRRILAFFEAGSDAPSAAGGADAD